MDEDIVVYVKLKEEDTKEFIAQRVFSKGSISFFLYQLLMVSLPFLIVDTVYKPLLLIFGALTFLPLLMQYIYCINYSKKNILEQELGCYTIDERGITRVSPSTHSFISWEDISEVNESRDFFCYTAKNIMSYKIIPKRCFYNQFQIMKFTDICRRKILSHRLKLYYYQFQIFSPDVKDPRGIKNMHISMDEFTHIGQNVIANFKFNNNEKETLINCVKLNILYFWRSPVFYYGVLLVFMSIYTSINVFLTKDRLNLVVYICVLPICFAYGALGVKFIFNILIFLYKEVHRAFKMGIFPIIPYNFSFYRDYLLVSYAKDAVIIGWKQITKIKGKRKSYTIYTSLGIVYNIPKRVIEQEPQQNNVFKELIKDKLV